MYHPSSRLGGVIRGFSPSVREHKAGFILLRRFLTQLVNEIALMTFVGEHVFVGVYDVEYSQAATLVDVGMTDV